MTAEIAILNKSAVALATDSKVTLSTLGGQKTYDTVDKVFSLSKTEPVGAMVYGNAEFMGFPWETIIKEYRRHNPRKRFNTVFDWADDLEAFLLRFFPFSEPDEDRNSIAIAAAWLRQVLEPCLALATSQDELLNLIQREVELQLAALQESPDFLSDVEWQELSQRIGGEFEKLADQLVPSTPGLKEPLVRLCEVATRKNVASPIASGVVVAGFGNNELLPSLVSFDIDGIAAKRLRAIETRRFDTTRNKPGTIIPFAQADMVYRFMEGIDPSYAVQVQDSIRSLIHQNALNIVELLGHSKEEIDELRPAIDKATEAAANTFAESNMRLRREQFAAPIIDMTMSLPKDELAKMAESLVSLTSLHRRVSREIETVGGAIDVAVISKGDGFVWIKRKHYFSPDRNLRFVSGYFSEFTGGQEQGGKHGNFDGEA